MSDSKHYVNLGFADSKMPPGTHICQIYNGKDERNEALLSFLLQGLLNEERTACFSDNLPEDLLTGYFAENGIPLSDKIDSGALTLSEASDIYFQEEGIFDPDSLLELVKKFHVQSVEEGYAAARIIGEMISDVANRPGGSRLLEYESRVSILVKKHPVTCVCQYDAHGFDGATIMDILKVHPMMLVRGKIFHNPFFVPPQEFLEA